MSVRRALIASALLALLPLAHAACDGTARVELPGRFDCTPDAGCDAAYCTCDDGVVVLTQACLEQECVSADAVCRERCDEHDGLTEAVSQPRDDAYRMPSCDRFCARLIAAGCGDGCETYFGTCEEVEDCSAEAEAALTCLADTSIFACEDGAVVMSGCDVEDPAAALSCN